MSGNAPWDFSIDAQNIGMVFDRSPFGLARLKAFCEAMQGESWDSLQWLAKGFAASDMAPYLGVWRSRTMSGGRTFVALDESIVGRSVLPSIWNMHMDAGGTAANYFFVAPAMQEQLHKRDAELAALVAAGQRPRVLDKMLTEKAEALLTGSLSETDRAGEMVRSQIETLAIQPNDGPSLMVFERGANTERILPSLKEHIGPTGAGHVDGWRRSTVRHLVVGLGHTELGALLAFTQEGEDSDEGLSACLKGMAEKMGPDLAAVAEVIAVADSVNAIKALRLRATGALGAAVIAGGAETVSSANTSDNGTLPWCARAADDLEAMAAARLVFSPKECKMLVGLAGLIRRSAVYRLPVNGDWLLRRAEAASPLRPSNFKLPAPAFVAEFESDEAFVDPNDKALRAATRRMALVVDLRMASMRWVLNTRDIPWLPDAVRAAKGGVLVMPLDYAVWDSTDSHIKPRWSPCLFAFWFFEDRPIQLVLQPSPAHPGNVNIGLGGGIPMVLYEAGNQAMASAPPGEFERALVADTLMEAAVAVQMACSSPSEFQELMPATDRHGVVYGTRG